MDEKILYQAVENVSLIKGVLEQTSKSFSAFSKIFIYWGLLFILSGLSSLIIILNKEQMLEIATKFPIISFVLPNTIIAIIAILVYAAVSRKIPLVGLEKHLMKLWVLILAMNAIPNKISINTVNAAEKIKNVEVYVNNLSTVFFSLAIALIITSLLTGYRQLRYVGTVYIIISVLYAYLNLAFLEGTLALFLNVVILPATFIYTGLFFKSKQLRRN